MLIFISLLIMIYIIINTTYYHYVIVIIISLNYYYFYYYYCINIIIILILMLLLLPIYYKKVQRKNAVNRYKVRKAEPVSKRPFCSTYQLTFNFSTNILVPAPSNCGGTCTKCAWYCSLRCLCIMPMVFLEIEARSTIY